ncbi:hypothetical protein RN001_016095 [Aquatica leii]|uniref:Uncharacterized protein n=1 Tax=Aquatica leii TaxID=1421715 RepID=A0AAN7P1A0_9COLE|nr:hypothetical protein RN001_016095 [Aquatica leii]
MVSTLAAYRREKGKEKKTTTTGAGRTTLYESRWYAYTALAFLNDRDKPLTGLSTEPSTSFKEKLTKTKKTKASTPGGKRNGYTQ